MKVAVKLTELYTRTVVLEAENYEEAEEKILKEYERGNLLFHGENSAVDLEMEDDSKNYVEIFGEEEFEKMEESEEFR